MKFEIVTETPPKEKTLQVELVLHKGAVLLRGRAGEEGMWIYLARLSLEGMQRIVGVGGALQIDTEDSSENEIKMLENIPCPVGVEF